MKKRIFPLIACGIFIISACGDSNTPPPAAQEKTALVSVTASGKSFENDLIRAIVPDRWWLKDDSRIGMMMILPETGNPEKSGVYLKFEGPNWTGTPEESIAEMAKNYQGTPPQSVVCNGRTFVQTSYEYSGSKQTMMIAKKDGTKITVTLEGAEHASSPAVRQILESLVVK